MTHAVNKCLEEFVGARALSARRGNSRVPGNRTESSSSRSGRGGGGRGKSPMTIANTPATGITTNGVFKPAIPERYCRNGINVGVGSAAMLSISSANGIISSDFYLHKKFKKIADVSEDVAAAGSEDDSKSNSAGSKTADVSASSSVVYKPKFRIVEKPEELNTPPMSESSTTTTPPPIPSPAASAVKEPTPPIEENKVIVPGKINSGERMDRQSLDDRISKIIDENQSILSSIREPWGKKQRNRQQQQQQQPQAQPQQNLPADLSAHRNGIVIMNGGVDGAANFSPVTLRPVETTASVVVPPQTTTTVLIRSHPDAGGQVVANDPNTDPLAPTDPLPNSSTVVPKKRRRLSPTPNRLCGGEVSELPKQEAPISQTHPKSYYHDVDMTVRVSKCGTSGARVTVRTNNNNNGATTAGSYSRLLDVPSTSPLKHIPQPEPLRGEPAVLFVHTDSQSPQQQMTSLSPLRYSPSATDLKGLLPRGRPPKKGKLVIDDQPASPSVIVNAAIKIPPSPSPVALKRAQISPPTAKPLEIAVVKIEPEDQPEASKGNSNMSPPPLVLQSSTPNPKRPTFLALKPLNPWPKKPDPGVLPSPETPRGARNYNQMYINGQAYTYLGFKVSTRTSYTCLLKPQPMFLEQDSDHKLSMYSNWQPRSRGKIQQDLPISLNDSRVNGRKSPRSFLFTLAGQKCTTETVDSPDRNKPIVSLIQDMKVASIPSSSSSSATELSPAIHISSQDPSPRKVEVGPSSSVPLNLAGSSNPRIMHDADYEAISSGSSCGGSADESVNLVVDNERDKRSRSVSGSRRLALNSSDYHDISRESTQEGGDDDKSSSSFSQFDNPRVKIMEGGFESNEDYTYVRGRGRGRYVCEACGIRCKKPSMLRKHLKTHTDLRPYTCKLCNFSFKTKGNLTKHQKSKSHHKKCIGLGIHPESQRSLAMIGPQFSDTNSTDESDDEDDAGCYNGDTDSQDEVDGDDASSSAEPENGELLSQSFEKEIAQSLLDLSKMGRMGSGEVVVMKNGMETPAFEVNRLSSGVNSNGIRQIPVAVAEADDNSLSVEHSSGGGNVEIPIDLSCRSKSSCGETDPKRLKRDNKNCYVRSFGVVAEAQKWEPEEEFMISGCLNLKKVPNDNNNSNKIMNVNGSFTRVNGTVMIPADVKPEVRGLNLNNNIGEKLPYEFQLGKRKREASTSSSYGEPVNFAAHLPKQSPAPSGPPPASAPPAVNHPQTPPKPQKLHQPWLSPEENKSMTEHAVVVVKQDVDCLRKSPTAVGNNYDQKVLDSCDLNREPGMMALSDPPRPLASSSPTPKGFPALTGFKPQAEFREPSGPQALVKDEGKAECNVCGKVFARASQLSLHMNIHYLERPFRCDPCGVSFRTKGHLIKHRRSSSHDCKVKVCLNDSWGVANEENPRPFKCPDCKIAFRIHGHLAKHLRSKMHIMRMECLGKLPFGIYFEMEKCGLNLTEIDTSDCDMSLISLQGVAKRIYGDSWTERLTVPIEEPV